MLSLALMAVLAAAGDPPPVVEAAKNGDEAALRALVEEGVDVNATAGDGSTALLWASHRDLPESVELLIEAGADVNRANDLGATPLWAAGENGGVAVAGLLLDAGADPKPGIAPRRDAPHGRSTGGERAGGGDAPGERSEPGRHGAAEPDRTHVGGVEPRA